MDLGGCPVSEATCSLKSRWAKPQGRRDYPPPRRIEFHTSEGDTKPTADHFATTCTRLLPHLIPVGAELRIIRWRQRAGGEQLHNRYILAVMGGVSFQTSLGEGGPGETDDVSVLESNVHKQRWDQFDLAHPAFDFAAQVVVQGTRPQKGCLKWVRSES